MIRKQLSQLIFDFFLHIEINTLNLPYRTALPRPYDTNKVSQVFKWLFERNWIHKMFGFNLAFGMLLIPLSTQLQTNPVINEHPVVITRTDMVSSYLPEDPSIITKPREYVVPVKNLKYIAQGYHAGHLALDMNADLGSPVYAFSDGKIVKIEDGIFGYGRHIIIDHGHDLFSLYAHLQKFNVQVGDIVDAGQQIGEVGMTGYTTGPHVHFEVHDGTKSVNPNTYLEL